MWRARLRAPVLLALDDTDDAGGGCTTHMLFRVLLALPELAPRGMPRLVRLNPNTPHKTRGNGAVCVELVEPAGPATQVGELQGHEIRAFPDGRPATPSSEILQRAWDVVQEQARPGANPAVAMMSEAPPSPAYWSAVRANVLPEEAASMANSLDVLWQATGDGRGLIGCLGAAAWPGPAASYEFIAYRHSTRVDTPREVAPEPLMRLDADGTTFHSFDPTHDVLTCVPHTPCPVLCGLRGLEPERLRDRAIRALMLAAREPVDAWLMWATNQASGDHVTPVEHVREAPDLGTIAVPATVEARPQDLRGGHVRVAMHDGRGHAFGALAFEPTKSFRDTVRALRPGDRLLAVGAWDGDMRLEKIRLDHVAPEQVKMENPRCPQCRKRMKSRGKDAGYRCPDGHGKAPEEAASRVLETRALRAGWYEVPVIARRHLHRPSAFEALE